MESRIGQQLRAAREAKRLTLEEVSFLTKIPVDRLEDLEADHLTQWGGMVYTRSFIKHYAEFLGIDLTQEIQRLPISPLAGSQDYQYLTQSYGPWLAAPIHQQTEHEPQVLRTSTSFKFFAIFTSGMLFMLLGLFFAYRWSTSKEDSVLPPPSPMAKEKVNLPRQSWKDPVPATPPTSLTVPSSEELRYVPKAIPVIE